MCWASTTSGNTRDAIEGESLRVIRHFQGVNWLVDIHDSKKAVCLRDNTIVAVNYEEPPALLHSKKKVCEEAIFRQKLEGVSGNDFFCFFESGQNKSLHNFPRFGTTVDVLKVPEPAVSDGGVFDLRVDPSLGDEENRELVRVRRNHSHPDWSGAD